MLCEMQCFMFSVKCNVLCFLSITPYFCTISIVLSLYHYYSFIVQTAAFVLQYKGKDECKEDYENVMFWSKI